MSGQRADREQIIHIDRIQIVDLEIPVPEMRRSLRVELARHGVSDTDNLATVIVERVLERLAGDPRRVGRGQ